MTARRNRNTATATRTRHELDEAVTDAAKSRMKGSAAPLLARIIKLEKAAQKNIAKREKFLDGSSGLKNKVRAAYDEGDESALKGVADTLDAFERSLLRPRGAAGRSR